MVDLQLIDTPAMVTWLSKKQSPQPDQARGGDGKLPAGE